VDNHEYVVAILMDLTKAVDCLRHNLLLGKLRTFGQIICIYLSNKETATTASCDRGPVYIQYSHRPSLVVIVRLFTLLTICSNLSYRHNMEVKHKVSPVTGLALKSNVISRLLSENQNIRISVKTTGCTR